MPSKDPIQRFNDILENIIRIEEFTAGMDVSAFVGDPKTYDAVERCLERISEAASKLGPQAEELVSRDSVGADTRRRKPPAA